MPEQASTKTADLPRLEPGDAAWLLVLVQNAVPSDTDPDSPMNWEGKGRHAAYAMLARAAGARLLLCGVNGCPLSDMHSGDHVEATAVTSDDIPQDLFARPATQ